MRSLKNGSSALTLVACVAASTLAQSQTSDDAKPKSLEERVSALEKSLSSPDYLRAFWKDGLKLESADKNVQLSIGGQAFFDAEWNKADGDLEATKRYAGAPGDTTKTSTIGPFEDGFEVRSARLNVSGRLYQHVEFRIQLELAKSALSDKDVFAGLVDLGDFVPNLRVGHQFEPFGLETKAGIANFTFLEGSLGTNHLSPQRNPGFLLWKPEKVDGVERGTWAVGVFRTDASDNGIGSGDGAYDVDARLTALPWYEDGGRELVHLGLATSRRGVPGRTTGAGNTQTLTFTAAPEADLLPNLLSTGAIPAESEWKSGAEALLICGPFSLQSEYMLDKVETSPVAKLDDPTFNSWYVQATYTLTGENRRYNTTEAVPCNLKPSSNAFLNGGFGAWELAARFSSIDFNDGSKGSGGIEGGKLNVATLGLNWYLNPNTRFMWDFSRADADTKDKALGSGGSANIFQMRVEILF